MNDTTTEDLGTPEARESECGCPEWVIACVHHAAGILKLTDNDLSGKPWWARWHVCINQDCAPAPNHRNGWNDTWMVTTNDREEALAAFREREAEIRREVFGR